VSSFFWRNPLQQQVVLGLFRGLYDEQQARRVLDVGVCTGENTLTYAMLLRDEYGEQWHERFPITAIDLDPRWIEQCRRGMYPPTRLYQMPRSYRARYVNEWQVRLAPYGAVREDISAKFMAIFKNTRLQDQITWIAQDFATFADTGPYSLAFCQNTLLHLPAAQSAEFLCKLNSLLEPGGYLVCAGRNASDYRTLHELGFEPVPHDIRAVYSEWIQRKNSKNPAIQLKDYDPADPLLAFKIGSVFRKGTEPRGPIKDNGHPEDIPA